MKTYNTQEGINKDVKDVVLKYDGDINITFDCVIGADIIAENIYAKNIVARNIITKNINAKNINTWDIVAENIYAKNISYYAFCTAYNNIKCKSIKSRRESHAKPICLDGELTIIEEEEKEIIELNGKKYKLIK